MMSANALLYITGLIMVLQINAMTPAQVNRQTAIQDEARRKHDAVYKEWFVRAQMEKDHPRAIDTAINYLESYPGGQYASYMKQWLAAMSKMSEWANGKWSGSENAKIKEGKTDLIFAAMRGDAEKVELLINEGVDLDAKENSYGRTALMYAIWNGSIQIISTLLINGADSWIKDSKGWTAIDHARVSGNAQVISLFDNMDNKHK